MEDQARAAWLAERRTGIGGSDIAAVFGMSPWTTPYQLWLDKRGEGEESDPNSPALYWGTILEDVVAKEYQIRTGSRVQRVNRMLRHPEADFACVNLDRAVVNPSIAGNVRVKNGRLTTDRVLECKTANAFVKSEWGDESTDLLPEHYLLQVQWEMGVAGVQFGDLAVLIGGNDFRVYSLEFDAELFANLLEGGEKFWKMVKDGTPPDPVNGWDAQHRWPKHMDLKATIVGPSVAMAVDALVTTKEEIKELVSLEEQLATEIKIAFQDAEAITHGGVRLATWKTQAANRVDVKAMREKYPDQVAEFTVESTNRILRLNKPKKD